MLSILCFISLLAPLSADFFARDGLIYDSAGRVRFFHGENFVQKGTPWYPEVLLDVEHIKEMESWGWNAVRLGVMWSGVEPEPGVFNETYITVISDMIDNLEAHGITALIDVHQDVISSYFCEYDGAPTWLIDLSNSSTQPFPWPLQGECSDRPWGSNYLAEETGAAFQDMYDNVNGMRDHFAAFWAKVARSLKSKDLLGYEIINEPWAGDIYKQPSLLLPGIAGSQNLQPLYDIISSAIRSEDASHMVFYEPVTWGMIFGGNVSGSGFDHVPGGVEYAEKSILSFHYYCWWYSSDDNTLQKHTCDKMFGPKVFGQVAEDVKKLGGAAMLTEWGQGCDFNSGLTDECDPIMDLADEHLMSWIDWWWTGTLMNGWHPTDEAIATYSRTYATAIAGVPTKMKFDATSLRFELCYTIAPHVSEPTVIYVNEAVHYTSGVKVWFLGPAAASMSIERQLNTVLVRYTGDPSAVLDVCVHIAKM